MDKTELDKLIEIAKKNTTQQYLRMLLNRASEKIDRATLSCFKKVLVELCDDVKDIKECIDGLIIQYDNKEVDDEQVP